jgi:hypothetical protein
MTVAYNVTRTETDKVISRCQPRPGPSGGYEVRE